MNAEKRTGTEQYGAFMARLLKSYGRRAAEGELDYSSLEQLADLQALLDEQIGVVVAALRAQDNGAASWRQIGESLGITRAAAFKRYGHLDPTDTRHKGGQPAHLR